jgi:translin
MVDYEEVTEELTELQDRYDMVMRLSREIIRDAGRAVTMVHVRDMKGAKDSLNAITRRMKAARKAEKGFEFYMEQAYQEYVEAYALYSIIRHGRIPTKVEAGVGTVSYLLGVMDLVGELKREAYEAMRRNETAEAERYYGIMKDIYDSTRHLRFANPILPNFRKKQDVARIQIEGTGGELLSRQGKQA